MSAFGEAGTNFASKVNPQDAGLIGGPDPRTYEGYYTSAAFEKDIVDLTAQSTSTISSTYQTLKNADRFERWWISMTVSALTATGGTYKRLCDGFGLFVIDHIELRNGATLLQTIYPGVETFERFMKEKDNETCQKLWPLVGLGLTPAQRNTLATAAQTFTIPVEFYWRDDPTKDPIVPAVANGFTVVVYWRDPSLLIQTDGTSPAYTVTSCTLRQELIQTEDDTRAEQLSMVMNGNSIEYLYDESTQPQPVVVTAGATSAQIPLTGLTGACKQITLYVRLQSDQNTAYGYDWTNLSQSLNPDSISIYSNNTPIMRTMRLKDFLQLVQDARYYTGAPWAGIVIPLTEAPESLSHVIGHANLTSVANPVLNLAWDTAIAANLVISTDYRTFNFIQMSSGSLRRLFVQ